MVWFGFMQQEISHSPSLSTCHHAYYLHMCCVIGDQAGQAGRLWTGAGTGGLGCLCPFLPPSPSESFWFPPPKEERLHACSSLSLPAALVPLPAWEPTNFWEEGASEKETLETHPFFFSEVMWHVICHLLPHVCLCHHSVCVLFGGGGGTCMGGGEGHSHHLSFGLLLLSAMPALPPHMPPLHHTTAATTLLHFYSFSYSLSPHSLLLCELYHHALFHSPKQGQRRGRWVPRGVGGRRRENTPPYWVAGGGGYVYVCNVSLYVSVSLFSCTARICLLGGQDVPGSSNSMDCFCLCTHAAFCT